MKKIALIFIAFILLSCDNDDNETPIETGLVGKWRIIEQLLDPGGGSGVFQPVTSDRVIEFFNDETVTVNGELCNLSSSTGVDNSGVYSITSSNEADTTYDGFIAPNNCTYEGAKINFSITQDNKLLLWYPCIEACGQMFVKIQ